MSKDTGGPAFPSGAYNADGLMLNEAQFPGMTLRDYFAAKAMQAMLACPMQPQSGPYMYGRDAYEMADAMLKVRAE